MPKPQTVFVQIKPPKDSFPGQVAEGMFIVEDGVVILTDRDGKPARDSDGKRYEQKLAEGQNPKVIAARLTRTLRDALRGANAPKRGFEPGPLSYSRDGSVV
jgi:hypothetical protein